MGIRRIRAAVRDDSGVIMVAVIGIIALATVVSISAFAIAQQSLTESERIEGESMAFLAADAGMEAALENISQNGFLLEDYPLSANLAGGTSYSVEVTTVANSEYKATSVGIGPDGQQETVVTRFFYLNIWEMNLATGNDQSLTAGGGGINGTSNVTGPFYVRGTIEMRGTAYIRGGPLFVEGGNIILGGNATIGQPAAPIYVYVTGTYPTNNFYASQVSASVPHIELPHVDQGITDSMWSTARSESVDNIMGSPSKSSIPNLETDVAGQADRYRQMQPPNQLSAPTWQRNKAAGASTAYKVVGNDSAASSVGNGTTHLTIGNTGSFGSWFGDGRYPANYNGQSYVGSHDDFAYDDVNNILYVEGTVFIDGNLTLNEDMRYVGNGTLFVNGNVTVNGMVRPLSTLNPAEALGIVTPKNIYMKTAGSNKVPGDPPDVAGALFAERAIIFDANILMVGSVVAGSIEFKHPNAHLVTNPQLPSFLPEGMPGSGAALLARGAWTRQ